MEQLKPLAMHDILTQTAQIEERAEQITFLKMHQSKHFHEALAFGYDDRVTWLLPVSNPPYKPYEGDDASMNFHRECRLGKLLYFVRGGKAQNATALHRENIFIQLLESLEAKDAELLLTLKNKKLPVGISKELIEEAYGELK